MSNLPIPAVEAVIWASRERLSEEHRRRFLDALQRCSEPDSIVRLAFTERVYALLASHLNEMRSESGDFGVTVHRRLKHAVVFTWLPYLKRLMETENRVREVLNAEGLHFLFLRGIAFSATYYDNYQNRVSADVDVLIRPEVVRQAVQALTYHGFSQKEKRHRIAATGNVAGQRELFCESTGVTVDLNWLLTGNAQIGKVPLDDVLVWSRAVPVEKSEYRLSPEDQLVHLIRHTGHGHDLGDYPLRTAVDVLAVIGRTPHLDWDHVNRQCQAAEMQRAASAFATFFDRYYATDSVRLSEKLGRNIWDSDRHKMVDWIILPQLSMKTRKRWIWRAMATLHKMAAKFWALDSWSRCARILRFLVLPTRDELVLLTTEWFGAHPYVGRALFYPLYLMPLLPAVLFGMTVRCGMQALFYIRRTNRL